MVFPIALGRDGLHPTDELTRLAEATGGQFFVASTVAGLGRIYSEIEEILRRQYLLVVEMDE